MRKLLPILFSLITLCGNGQFNKSISAQVTGNFDLTLKGLATNDAGVGLGCDVSLLAKHKLQTLLETNGDYFIGDKLLIIGAASGKESGTHLLIVSKQGHSSLSQKVLLSPPLMELRGTPYAILTTQ